MDKELEKEMISYAAKQLSEYIDSKLAEEYLDTAISKEQVDNLCKLIEPLPWFNGGCE